MTNLSTESSRAPMLGSRRHMDMALLGLAVTAGTYARTLLGPLQEALGASLDLSDNQLALLQGPALALPLLVMSVPLGLLIDRRSRVRLLLLKLATRSDTKRNDAPRLGNQAAASHL